MSRFNVYFSGNRNDIEAEVLLESIGNVTELLSYVNEQTDSEKDIKITIEAPERGSFGIDVNLISDAAGLLMGQGDVIAYTEALVSTLIGMFELHQFLDGDEPEDVRVEGDDNVVVTNSNGNKIHIDQTVNEYYFGDEDPRQLLRGMYAAVERDENIDSLQIRDPESQEPEFESPREEFDRLSQEEEEEERETQVITDENERVTITRVIFDNPDRRWEFLWDGEQIGAKIEDLGFWAEVETGGMSFRRGDRLEVDIDRRQEYNESLNAWETTNYTVAKVHDYIPAEEQGDLFSDDEEDTES